MKRSKLGLGNRDVARVSEQVKSSLRYGGARFLYALNTNTALLIISFSLSGSSPKYRSFVSVVKEERAGERRGRVGVMEGAEEGQALHGVQAVPKDSFPARILSARRQESYRQEGMNPIDKKAKILSARRQDSYRVPEMSS